MGVKQYYILLILLIVQPIYAGFGECGFGEGGFGEECLTSSTSSGGGGGVGGTYVRNVTLTLYAKNYTINKTNCIISRVQDNNKILAQGNYVITDLQGKKYCANCDTDIKEVNGTFVCGEEEQLTLFTFESIFKLPRSINVSQNAGFFLISIILLGTLVIYENTKSKIKKKIQEELENEESNS